MWLDAGVACYSSRGNDPGMFQIPDTGGNILELKLTHVSGKVTCTPKYQSTYWGCNLPTSPRFMLFITDDKKNILFPHQKHFRYNFSPYTVFSKTLVIKLKYSDSKIITNYRLWFSEDYNGASTSDNSGKVCAKVEVTLRRS